MKKSFSSINVAKSTDGKGDVVEELPRSQIMNSDNVFDIVHVYKNQLVAVYDRAAG